MRRISAVDPVYQRVLAHQPVLSDAARQIVALLDAPAVAVVDVLALPASFSEPWRTGQVDENGPQWGRLELPEEVDFKPEPITLQNARVVIGAGRGLHDAGGFELARRLAQALGGAVSGDLGALDAGWIREDQLLSLTGHKASPKVYLALGIAGDTEHLAALQGADTILAVQNDPTAPITQFADWNVIADPVQFAQALLARLVVGS